MADIMQVEIAGKVRDIHVPGWDEMRFTKRTANKALTLLAMCNLEVKQVTEGGLTPTHESILQEVRRLGGTLSRTSTFQIQKNIDDLERMGHVVSVKAHVRPARGRGAPTGLKQTQYIYPLIRELLANE